MSNNPVSVLNDIKQEQLDIVSEELDDRNGRPWDEKQWKEQREELIADECSWCGDSDEPLQLHHYDEPDFDWEREWIRVEDELFLTSDAFDPEEHLQEPSKCPRCTSTNTYARKTKTPTHRCRRCDYEFPDIDGVRLPDLLAAEWPGVYATRGFFDAKVEWVKQNTDAIRAAFKEAYNEHWEQYLSLEKTITICRRCHFMHHEHDMKICESCGDDYGKERDIDDYDYLCWPCFAYEKGLALCPECGDGYYNPEYTNKCKDCR